MYGYQFLTPLICKHHSSLTSLLSLQISLDPNWTPIDEDLNDDPTYTIVGGNINGYFAIDPTTSFITSTLEYDVDQNAMPTTDFIVVQVRFML